MRKSSPHGCGLNGKRVHCSRTVAAFTSPPAIDIPNLSHGPPSPPKPLPPLKATFTFTERWMLRRFFFGW